MTTTTIYSDAADGGVYGFNVSTYATARSTATVANTTDTFQALGQKSGGGFSYYCYELFFWFATATIPDADTVSAATLSLYGQADNSTTDFTLTAALHNWGDTLTTADWVAGASLSGLTTVASRSSSGWSTAAYNDFTDVAFPANVDKTANTRLIVYSSRHSGNNTPSGDEHVFVWMADETGTTKDPKLTVVHAPPTAIKKINSTAQASVKKYMGVPIASVKKAMGVA